MNTSVTYMRKGTVKLYTSAMADARWPRAHRVCCPRTRRPRAVTRTPHAACGTGKATRNELCCPSTTTMCCPPDADRTVWVHHYNNPQLTVEHRLSRRLARAGRGAPCRGQDCHYRQAHCLLVQSPQQGELETTAPTARAAKVLCFPRRRHVPGCLEQQVGDARQGCIHLPQR
eukprot:COSAG02_NODE_1489_length_12365_cov_22.798793_6_plen_173_part_00